MKLFTFQNNIPENSLLKLNIPHNIKFNKIKIVSSSFYSIYYQNNLVQFGPFRRTNYYLNENELALEGNTNLLDIKIIFYGIPTFDLDCRKFIFGIELLYNDEVVLNLEEMKLVFDPCYIQKSNRFSFQRGFIERYDLTNHGQTDVIKLLEIKAASIISHFKDTCLYTKEAPKLISTGSFKGFDNEFKGYNHLKLRENFFDVVSLINSFKSGYTFYKYKFNFDVTGIIHVKFKSDTEQTIYLVFNEHLPNDKWIYARSTCNELIEIKLKKGENEIFSNSPYTYLYLMVLAKDNIEICLIETIKIQNDLLIEHKCGNKEIDKLIEASKRTFAQNAVDVFTDCPSRERAGWLCDSYFLGIAEPFYSNNHLLEKAFLENFAYGSFPEISDGMVPMCFPSIHEDHTFIPNWALWFIVEIERYYNDTNDYEVVALLKDRVFGILEYFKKFENEYNLLENLESWDFIEWSKATEDNFIKPVSFVSNMLYKGALESAGKLYNNDEFLFKSDIIAKNINKMSFNGKYFLDNAKRINGNLVATKDLISETAQYFAYFFNIKNDNEFKETIFKAPNDASLVPSAVFIGKFLRLLILYKENKYKEIINEFVPYFSKMANATGTLWEKETPDASCNHGFTSILGFVLFNCCKQDLQNK